MILPDLTIEHLKQLPLRGIVAFAARCARRVELLAQLPEGHPQCEERRAAVAAALALAEGFARGSPLADVDAVAGALDACRGAEARPARGESAAEAAAEAAHAAATAWTTLELE